MGLNMRRRGLCALLVLATGVVLVGCAQRSEARFKAMREPVIAVLCQMSSEVVLLDPSDLSVERRIPLRSQSLDMDVSGREILTAQSGGHGADMGREFGRIDLDAGTTAYTALESMDIQMVSAASDGWLMLTTGLVSADGQWLHRVSPDGQVANLKLDPGVCGCVATDEVVWVWHYWDDETGNPKDRYLIYGPEGSPRSITSEQSMTVSLCGFRNQVVALGVEGKRAKLVSHDALTGAVGRVGYVGEFEVGPSYAWSAGPYVAIADGPYGDFYQATGLLFVDPVTLEIVGSIKSLNGVSAVNEGPNGQLIVCEGDGTVSLVEPGSFHVRNAAVIGDPRGDLVDAEYVP